MEEQWDTNRIARHYGLEGARIRYHLKQLGVQLRTRGEAHLIWWRQLPQEYRDNFTKSGIEANTGRKQTLDYLRKKAKDKEGITRSWREDLLVKLLQAKGYVPVPAFVDHIFTIDVAFPDIKLGIECWTSGSIKAEKNVKQRKKKYSHFLRKGWKMIDVIINQELVNPDYLYAMVMYYHHLARCAPERSK